MAKLSVNVNKIATIRNSRGGNNPDLLSTVSDIIRYGAHGITVHPRPDERHIRRDDVYLIAENINVEFNIEGYPSDDFIRLVKEIGPAQCTLVPDPPDVLTSNAGWNVIKEEALLTEVVGELRRDGIRTSVFFSPHDINNGEMDILKHRINADRIELYTEEYARDFHTDSRNSTFKIYQRAATKADEIGLEINAGHDLDLDNLNYFIKGIPETAEVSIGHAIICDSLYLGLEETIKRYLNAVIVAQE